MQIFPIIPHDLLPGFVANKHIDWTSDQGATNIHKNNLADSGNWDIAYGWGDHASGGYQAQGDILDDLNTLGIVGADAEFLVGVSPGVLAWESGATVRTSIGLGTNSSPTFTGLTIYSVGGNTTAKVETDDGYAVFQLDGAKTGEDGTVALFSFLNEGDSIAQFQIMRAGADDAGDFRFATQPAGGAMTHRLTISSTGNVDIAEGLTVDTDTLVVDAVNHRVGIGTTAPDSIFHIKANVAGTVGSHPAGQLIIQDPDDTVFGNAVITGYESDGAGNPDQQLWYLGSSSSGNSNIIFLNRRNSKLQLGTNGVSQLTILGDGKVGIGETSPQDTLEVNGTVLVKDKLIFTQDDRNEFIDSLADGYMDYGATTAHRFNNPIEVSQIGIAADTDLLQLAANALTVNGTVTATGDVQGADLYVADNLIHVGDVDTKIVFDSDQFYFQAGNLRMMSFIERALGIDEVVINDVGSDIDFRVETVGQSNALFVRGSDGKVGINDAAPASVLDITGDINTTENYKVDDVQVVGNQGVAVADATDADDVILRLNDLLARVRAHGLIAA